MTSRLKRKLENIGVDVQSNSSRLTENFCLIGTPLPPLEKAKDSGEFIPLWKQEVRDEKGRRRLHGAFTGGFSAGYYNTVGSKEGWTPSTFTSSRGDRASSKQAKPEDFMDEEDLAELRESKKLVDMTEETDIFSGTRAELSRGGGGADKDSITSALESLIPPSKDSVGARLLRKMGWRPGQGIGPRVSYKQLRAQDGIPIGKDEAIDEEASKHLYAPRDTKVVAYHMNENAFGLGYTPGQGLTEIVRGRNGNNAETGPKLSIGFGLGALNDAEDDDLDVYDQGLMKENRRMAYDTREMEEDERVFSHGKDSSATKKRADAPSVASRDGKPIVSGFVLAEKPLIESRWFPMSDVPAGWQPDPRRVWAKDISNSQDRTSDSHRAAKQLDHRSWLKGKTADERGSMLGEVPLPSAPRSVFDYLSEKDRDRLKNLAANLASHSPPLKQTQPPSKMDIPHIDTRTAQAALKGFQPFATNLEKQRRYTAYLQSQAAPSESEELKALPGQSGEDFIKEISDYIKSAQIFKPISGAMAGRFASASTMEMLGSTNQGLHKPTKEEYARLDEPGPEEEKDTQEESPKANAARMGMFGPLTRETKVWQPARLLCRRFGVKDPHPDGTSAMAEDTGGKPQAWTAELVTTPTVPDNNTSSDATVNNSAGSSAPPASSSGSMGRRDISNIGMGEDEEQGKDTLTYERPTKDIFKAIFASDEEDSDDEPDEDLPSSIPQSVPSAVPKMTSPNNRLQEASSEEKAVDLTNFRPTFIPKSERGDRKKVAEKDGPKKKDRDKKKKGKIVVSFDIEDEGRPRNSEQRKEKRRKKEKVEEADSESMWVEKPPPEITKNLVIPVTTEPDESDRPHRGRKRAVDFL